LCIILFKASREDIIPKTETWQQEIKQSWMNQESPIVGVVHFWSSHCWRTASSHRVLNSSSLDVVRLYEREEPRTSGRLR
jgi:hypothetical protein